MAIELSVVTPEGSLFKGAASFVAVPGADGEIGILPGHAALIAQLGIGGLRIATEDDETERFALRGGFLQVMDDKVTLLATDAARPEDLDADALKSEHDEVLEALQHPQNDEEFQELLARRRWVEARQALVGG
ncbi:MAG: ATP synthase F1 subunit epsilon [Planctomycetota bacterium]|jgi:F-type H+-transporting ATPase subunit epsilon